MVFAAGASDPRPLIVHSEAPRWGLHAIDAEIAQGNLVEFVRTETAAYRA